jgi:chromosome segregation ATPase
MTRARKALIVLTVAAFGLWGCAQGPSNNAAQAERIKALEAKCGKLEEDYRAVAAARDQARKRVVALEEEKSQLQKEVEALHQLAKERDELRVTVDARTNERDALQMRCDRLKKGLQNLLGQDDALLPPTNPPVTAAAAPTVGKSS